MHPEVPHLTGGSGAEEFREQLETQVRDGAHSVVVDLSGVEYVDTVLLAALLRARKQVAGQRGELVLSGVSEPVHTILRTAGADVFRSFEHTAEAVALLREQDA